MAVRAPDFVFEKRLYDGYRLSLGEGATSVLMDDESLKNVISNREPLDSEKFTLQISQAEKVEFDRWFNQDVRRSGFFIYEPVTNPTPREKYYVLGRFKDSAIIAQRLVVQSMEGPRVWEIDVEVEFSSRRALRAPLGLYPNIPNLNVTELIHVPLNNRSRYDSLYQDPIPLDWTGLVRVQNLEETRPPTFTIPDINRTSSLVIRYGTPIDLEGLVDTGVLGGVSGEYTFTTQGIIFYNPTGNSYVSVWSNGTFQTRERIWVRRSAAMVDSSDLLVGFRWREVRNPTLLNNLATIREGPFSRLDNLNVLLYSRQLTEEEMDAILTDNVGF